MTTRRVSDDPAHVENETLESGLRDLLLGELPSIEPPVESKTRLRARLVDKIGQSAAQNARFRTVRAHHGDWQSLIDGVQIKRLWSGDAGNSVLIKLLPGARLPVHRHRYLEEGIVLEGRLQMGELDLGPSDYHLSFAGSRHDAISSREGAIAFLRGTSIGDTFGSMSELLGGMLPGLSESHRTSFVGDPAGWEPVAPGITRKLLHVDGHYQSYFCRLEAGADCTGHHHLRDEECMILQGELFLGDLLLLAGDYQLAPAGTEHPRISSDRGALLFVRGPIV